MATEKQKREVMGDDKKETNAALEKNQHSQYMSPIRQQSRDTCMLVRIQINNQQLHRLQGTKIEFGQVWFTKEK